MLNRIKSYFSVFEILLWVFDGHGSKDKMNMIFIVLPRKEAPKMLNQIRRVCENKVFVVASEVSKYAGGYGMMK